MAKQETTKIISAGALVQSATAFVKANEVAKATEKLIAPVKKTLNEGVQELFLRDLDHVAPGIFTCYKIDAVSAIADGEGVLVEIPTGKVASVVAKFGKQEVSAEDADAILKAVGSSVYDSLVAEEEVAISCGLTDALEYARLHPASCTVSCGVGGVSISVKGTDIPGIKTEVRVFTAPDFLETVRLMDADVRKPILAILKRIIKAGTSFAVGTGTREIDA